MLDWDDQRYHEQYTKSTDYVAVGDILTPILAAPPVVFHAHLDQEILATVLEAPIVELITFYSVSDGFQDILRGALSSRYSLFVDAPIIEELVQQPGGENGSAHFAAIARDSGVECSELHPSSGH